MALTRVLITVKTYPAISKKYEELVCTAGFREDGSWIRIYPIQFRKKSYQEQYSKYEWIELDLVKNTSDPRPESFRPISHDTPINVLGKIAADGGAWVERRKIALNNVYTNLSQLIYEARNKEICTSLAVFKPSKIIDFIWEEVEREWSADKLAQFRQLNLFQTVENTKFEIVKKLPYKFSFVYEDDEGKQSTTMIEDWEVGELFWNCLKRRNGDEQKACGDVRLKYFDNFSKTKDLYFFLGTSQVYHFTSKNPFLIIGAFYPKNISQLSLF
jgi:hypothetical protein